MDPNPHPAETLEPTPWHALDASDVIAHGESDRDGLSERVAELAVFLIVELEKTVVRRLPWVNTA